MKNVDIETQSKIYIFDQELNENENNFINLNNEPRFTHEVQLALLIP